MKVPLTILTAVLFFGNLSLHADCCHNPKFIRIRGEAAPEVKEKIRTNKPFPYRQIYQNIVKNNNVAILEQDLLVLYASLSSDRSAQEAAYMKLYNDAQSIITNYCPTTPEGSIRVVVTAANGLVIVDTDRGPENTLDNFLLANLGSGFNSRIAILDAQAWPAGVGVERQFDFDLRFAYGSAVAVRLGPYLNNQGTVRLTKF